MTCNIKTEWVEVADLCLEDEVTRVLAAAIVDTPDGEEDFEVVEIKVQEADGTVQARKPTEVEAEMIAGHIELERIKEMPGWEEAEESRGWR